MIKEEECGENVDIKSIADKVSVQDGKENESYACLVGRLESRTKK